MGYFYYFFFVFQFLDGCFLPLDLLLQTQYLCFKFVDDGLIVRCVFNLMLGKRDEYVEVRFLEKLYLLLKHFHF